MAKSTAVEKAEKGQVPALASTPAIELTAEDVALPRLYLGQYMSSHVQEGRVPAGCIFTALGEDDPEPNVLWEPGQDDGVVFHVLALRKGKSLSVDGELLRWDYNDPDAPPDAWTTYNYVVALPAIDEDVPYKWLLTRTGQPTARQINLVIARNQDRGPAHQLAFEARTAPRENQKGKFFVPRVRHIEAKDEHVKIAEQLATMISGQAAEIQAAGSREPEPEL